MKGSFDSEEEFVSAYHILCVDIAREEFNLSEAEFLCMFNEHDLSSEDAIKGHHEDLATKLLAELDAAPTPSEPNTAEELAKQAEERNAER